MTGIGLTFFLFSALALLVLPRRWAPLPLLVAACYMTNAQAIEVMGLKFNVLRLLVIAGLIRVLIRSERPAGGLTGMEKVLFAWAGWAIFSSFFHKNPSETLEFHLGLIYNTLGIFFLIRIFCQDLNDAVHLVKLIAIVLLPVALEMANEHLTGRNLFSVLGGVPETVAIRGERLRAQGPFAHPILAGTVGASCLPLMIGIWRMHPLAARIGSVACLLMVLCSSSSGPLLSAMAGIIALILWQWRHLTRQMRIAAVVGYILLDIVMKAPAYYLIARIDLTGGSTGWHRARLIESSMEHLNEWWFAGTDNTREWMATGVSWSVEHTDITNYYLKFGVLGGLPLMLLFIWILWKGFRYVGEALERSPESSQFIIWALGAGLFAHAASAISVSYFDQSFLFIYLNLAVIASTNASGRHEELTAMEASSEPELESLETEPAPTTRCPT